LSALHPDSFIPREIAPGTQRITGWVGPSRSGRGGEEKHSQRLPGLELPIIQPVAQRYIPELSLVRLSCHWVHTAFFIQLFKTLFLIFISLMPVENSLKSSTVVMKKIYDFSEIGKVSSSQYEDCDKSASNTFLIQIMDSVQRNYRSVISQSV
jgi:hypothetical protein